MKAKDVFRPQGQPTVTLVREPVDEKSSVAFDDAVEEGGRLLRVVGPSKSGKTVFVQAKAEAAQKKLVRVSIAGIQSSGELWNRVLAEAGGDAEVVESRDSEATFGAETGGKVAAGVLIAKTEIEGKAKLDYSRSSGTARTRAADPLQTAIGLLAADHVWVFLDDFHYVKEDIQQELAQQLKHAAEEGVQLIIALIPGRSEDLIRKNSDLQGRIVDINFNYWKMEELALIAEQGFPAMNMQLAPGSASQLAREAAGTPQLMQAICLELCRAVNARDALAAPKEIDLTDDLLKQVFEDIATTRADFSGTIEQMLGGPPTRGQSRKIYLDSSGDERDVYELIVDALGLDPPQLKLTADELQARVDGLASTKVASVWESMRHISSLANGLHQEMKIDFGGELRWVSVLDPYLLFALRWR